jgi:hypothetical protein
VTHVPPFSCAGVSFRFRSVDGHGRSLILPEDELCSRYALTVFKFDHNVKQVLVAHDSIDISVFGGSFRGLLLVMRRWTVGLKVLLLECLDCIREEAMVPELSDTSSGAVATTVRLNDKLSC